MADKITMGADGLRCQTSRSSPSSRVTGSAPTSGRRPCGCSMPPSRRPTAGRAVDWLEVLAGEKAYNQTGQWLPDETVAAFRSHLVGIKGPLTTPVGGGIRSLNVALRQTLDLYACLRPVRWFEGVPSPVRHPELVDMVIFRENTEDVYAGKELEAGTEGAAQLLAFLASETFGWDIRARQRDRAQAGLDDRVEAAGAGRHAVCAGERAPLGDAGPQGQHHEVHRGRLPLLGLRGGRATSSPTSPCPGRTAVASRGTSSWSRTSSPMPCSSRCSPGPPSTT